MAPASFAATAAATAADDPPATTTSTSCTTGSSPANAFKMRPAPASIPKSFFSMALVYQKSRALCETQMRGSSQPGR